MPRRGRHRTRLPFRLLAAVAALLVGGTAVVLGGSALAKDSDGGSGGGSSILSALTGSSGKEESDSDDSGSGKDDGSEDSGDGSKDSGDGSEDSGDGSKDSGDGKSGDGKDQSPDEAKKTDDQKKDDQDKQAKGEKKVEFAGRDKIQAAGADEYVDITDVEKNGNIGDGGVFTPAGQYSVDCGVSDHNNSDNYMAAPGKRNGAQHVHDYVGNTSTNGNSTDESLDKAGTSCGNGDRSTFFWPVLRDLNGTDSDANADGGGKDGNVGRKLTPLSAKLTFRGHGSTPVEPLPQHLMNIMGNAKAKVQDGKNANAKYTCTGFEDRVTAKYPICPSDSKLVRILDYPSCWDGQNLESKDLRSHMAYPDESGNCRDDFKPVPALRITLTYDQPAGRAFAIDTFPDNQHDPDTDHSDFENLASKKQNETGAACINDGRLCSNV